MKKLRERKKKKRKNNFPVPYNPRLTDYGSIFRQHRAHMVSEYPKLKRVMSAPPRICYRRPKNLRVILVRAKVLPPSSVKPLRQKQDFKRCTNSRCQCCPFTVNTKTHSSLYSQNSWSIQSPVDCNTNNCVYAVTWKSRVSLWNRVPVCWLNHKEIQGAVGETQVIS